MGITESFLVNADKLNSIIDTLIENGEVPDKITDEKLKSIGFDNPADLLVIHIFKELKILEEDGTPTELFEKLIQEDTSSAAIAEGIIHGYKDLIVRYPDIYKMKPEDIQEKIDAYFKGEKTELVVKYMSNTFKKLVSYAGYDNFEDACARILDEEYFDNEESGSAGEEIAEVQRNGSETTQTVSKIKQEEKGEQSVDELLANSEQEEQEDTDSVSETATDTESQESDIAEEFTKNRMGSESTDKEKQAPPPSENKEPSNNEETKEDTTMQTIDTMPSTNKKVQKAFIKKADLLYKLERYEELVPSLKNIIEHFDGAEEPVLKEAVEKSIIRRALILGKLGRNDELLPALNDVISRFEDSDKQEYYDQASMAMLNKANLLESKNKTDQLLPLYEKIIHRLNDTTTPKIREKVNNVFLSRVTLLLEQDEDKEKALNAIDELIERFKNTEAEKDKLEEAMYKKAEIHEELGQDEEALQAYDEFIEMFGNKVEA